jgi:glycosyltransferase involved in cell wall biosynthesis
MNKPLKVLWYFSFPGGGIGRYSHWLCNELAGSGAVELHFLGQAGFEWRDEARYTMLPELFRLSHPIPLLRRMRFVLAQWINPRRLIRSARTWQPDVVHLADVNHLLANLWAGDLFGQSWRVVMTVHDVKRQVAVLNRRLEDHNLIDIYRRCDALFVHSENQRRELLDFAGVDPEHIHVVPHGPSPLPPPGTDSRPVLRARWQIPADARVLLFFGFIKDYKGLDILLQALALLPAETRLHLVIAGAAGSLADSSWNRCQHFINEAGLGARVSSHIRYLNEDEMAELFALSDALVLPYKPVFTSQSGVLNIASAVERPIIATPCPAFVEGMQGGRIGIIARDFTPEAFRDAISEYCANPDAGWEFARYREHNSWERSAAITRAVYRQVVDQPA